jgi:Ca2+-binding RTX toxin-like protein
MQYVGRPEPDTVEGGDEDDRIGGAGGNDRLFGGHGRDEINGEAGNDLLSSDGIIGTFATSLFDGGAEADTVRGGAGDDVVAGGWNDTLAGGEGTDVLFLDLRGATTGVRLNLQPVALGKPVSNGIGTISGFEAMGAIFGSAFDDDIRVGDLRTFSLLGGGVYGREGNDRIDGGTFGANTSNALFAKRLDGGAGDDVVIGSGGSDTLVGGDGSDRLIAGDGNDSVYAGTGDDLIDVRGFGNDYVDADAGKDIMLLSGTRSDWFVQIDLSDGDSDGTSEVTLRLNREQAQPNGASGRQVTVQDVETFRFEDRNVTLGQLLAGTVIGTDGDDLLTPGHTGYAGVRITAGADTLYGGGGSDVLDGGAGADTLYGGNGQYGGDRAPDTFYLRDAGDRVMDAGEGDTIYSWFSYNGSTGSFFDGAPALVQLRGAADVDVTDAQARRIVGNGADNHLSGTGVLEGGAGDDILESLVNFNNPGGATASYASAAGRVIVDLSITEAQNTRSAGVDTLIGIHGLVGTRFDDVLRGSALDDVIEGGEGDDRLIGGLGIDTASYAGAARRVTVDLGTVGAQDTGAGRDTLSAFEGLIGSAFNDRLKGTGGDNLLRGGAGDDVLVGLAGNDVLEGGDGDDRLNGGSGGDDLSGGGGADLFIFDTDIANPGFPYSYDRINGFNAAEGDRIDLSAVDADRGTVGDQAFRIVSALTGSAGELVLDLDIGFGPCIAGDTNGDGEIDLLIYAGYQPFPDTALIL